MRSLLRRVFVLVVLALSFAFPAYAQETASQLVPVPVSMVKVRSCRLLEPVVVAQAPWAGADICSRRIRIHYTLMK